VSHILETTLNLFFPPKCVYCGQLLEKEEHGACHRCLNTLKRHHGSLVLCDGVECRAPFAYQGDVRESLHRFKFGGAYYYATEYATQMQSLIPEGVDFVTWIPVSRIRKWQRGYDQAELLAVELSKKTGISAVKTLTKKQTRRQSATKNAAERKKNIQGAFSVRNPADISGKRILLIDDICTTGATLSEAIKVLKQYGAADISCLTLAMTEVTQNNR